MMTPNVKNRWVFPLAPDDCCYAKLNEYFGKLRDAKIEVPQEQGDFGDDISVREFGARRNSERNVKWGVSKR